MPGPPRYRFRVGCPVWRAFGLWTASAVVWWPMATHSVSCRRDAVLVTVRLSRGLPHAGRASAPWTRGPRWAWPDWGGLVDLAAVALEHHPVGPTRPAARRGLRRGSVVHGALMVGVPGRLELEGRVLDVEVTAQAVLQPVQHRGAPAVVDDARVHHDVGREHREPGGDRPGVQLVHVADPSQHGHVAPDLAQVNAARARLE